MQSYLRIARCNKSYTLTSDESTKYIELKGYGLKVVLGDLVDSTKIQEHYDSEGVLRYIVFMIYLKS